VERWHYEPGGFHPLAKEVMEPAGGGGEGAAAGRFYPVVTDAAGTPKEMFAETGGCVWRAEHTLWGRAETARAVLAARRELEGGDGADEHDCPLRFQNQWWDAESGLHYNLHRHYDPGSGQYLSVDPIGLDGGPRTHAYVHDPLQWCDPWGLAGCDPLQKLADRGFTGVKRNANGGLDYSESNALYNNPSRVKPDGSPVSSTVKIKYTGDYQQDFQAASQAGFGQNSTPSLNGDQYVWHHVDDYDPVSNEGSMQLVNQDAHLGIPHTGGVSQYQAATGNQYTFRGR
jgi:RHS repeat-associated protein